MKQYEITYLVENEDAIKNDPVAEAVKSLGGKIDQTKRWGQRNLAYPIKKLNTAFYSTAVFEMDPLHLVDLSRQLNLSGKVMRFLIVKDVQIADQGEQQFARSTKHEAPSFVLDRNRSGLRTGGRNPKEKDTKIRISKPEEKRVEAIASEKELPQEKREIVKSVEKKTEVKPVPAPKPVKTEKFIEKPEKIAKPKVKPTKPAPAPLGGAPAVSDEERLKQLESKLEDLLKS